MYGDNSTNYELTKWQYSAHCGLQLRQYQHQWHVTILPDHLVSRPR